MNFSTKTLFKHTKLGKLVKKFLHTKIGTKIGYFIGISGYNKIDAKIIRKNGDVEYLHSYNDRVDVGAALHASLLAGEDLGGASSASAPEYIALSTSTLTPAQGDTSLTGETSATGLGRTEATIQNYSSPASLDAACSYEAYNEFTNSSGGSVTIKSAALFDAASGGNMFVEANLSDDAILKDGDKLQITWTVNL